MRLARLVLPSGGGGAQHHLVFRLALLGLHQLGDGLEIAGLTGVEVIGELDVGADHPPVVRQADGEVAAMLAKLEVADLRVGLAVAGLAEQEIERVEPIIPVVVAGNDERHPLARGA